MVACLVAQQWRPLWDVEEVSSSSSRHILWSKAALPLGVVIPSCYSPRRSVATKLLFTCAFCGPQTALHLGTLWRFWAFLEALRRVERILEVPSSTKRNSTARNQDRTLKLQTQKRLDVTYSATADGKRNTKEVKSNYRRSTFPSRRVRNTTDTRH